MECQYGCGKEALYQLKNKKWCCSEHYNSCSEQKRKNSKGGKLAHKKREDYSYLKGKPSWKKGKDCYNSETIRKIHNIKLENIFCLNKKGKKYPLKKILINNNLKDYKCEICGLTKWNEKEIVLELDHINGKRFDNRLENLRFLCPNCHSQTETFRGRNNTGKIKVSDKELLEKFNELGNIHKTLIAVNLAPKGGNYKRMKKLIAQKQLIKEGILC